MRQSYSCPQVVHGYTNETVQRMTYVTEEQHAIVQAARTTAATGIKSTAHKALFAVF